MVEKVGRLFIGIEVPAEARAALNAELVRWNEGKPLPGKPVPPRNWHLTLQFLGSIDQVAYERVLSGLDQADRGRRFDARLSGLGTFPSPRKASVLWVGIDRGLEEFERLAGEVEEAARSAGLVIEERPFKPHLTLSRVRPPQDLRPLLERFPITPVTFEVARLAVFRSHQDQGAPWYEILEAFGLA